MRRKPDYRKYSLSKGEFVVVLGKWLLLDGVVSYLLYRSFAAFLIGGLFFGIFLKWEKHVRRQKREKQLNVQFKDSLQIILSGLEAGYSVENAFSYACGELWQMYQCRNAIIDEFMIIKSGLAMNESIEVLLMDFAERSGLEDIKSFAELVWIVKRRGGNLAELIRSSIVIIQEKMEVYQEIETILSGKKMEQKIMSVMPLAILFYVDVTSPGFFDVMYDTIGGVIIMSASLLLYVISVGVGKWIVNVEV